MNTLRAFSMGALWCLTALSAAATDSVELDYRLRAGRDLISEQVDEHVTTMRVAADRGMVARTAGNGTRFPLTYHAVTRQRSRYLTGPAQADGSFAASLAILSRRASLRLSTGEEQPVPGQPDLANFEFKATIDAQGQVTEPTLVAEGADAATRDAVRDMMASLLQQAARIDVVRLDAGQAVQQVVNMKVPLPGMPPLDMQVTGSNRLIAVQDGLAQVEMVYVMAFNVPEGPLKIEASGSGGGKMQYDIAAKIARNTETSTLMTILIHLPDGTLEQQVNMRQTQRVLDAAR